MSVPALQMKICSIGDCGRPHYAKSMCTMHYNRTIKLGTPGTPHRLVGEHGGGSTGDHGYRIIHAAGHPMARSQGKVLEHRVVLYDSIGEGSHPCHWCGKSLTWRGRPSARICADHLDFNRLNNISENLVPSCLDCNTKRRPTQ